MTTLENSKRDIQGFITSGYGHTYHSAYLFLKITDVAQAKTWLGEIIPQVNTAESWRGTDPCTPLDKKPSKVKPEQLLNIAFSFDGLAAIGLPDLSLRSFPKEMQDGMHERDRARLLGDTGASAPENWFLGGPNNAPFHLVLILHTGASPEAEDAMQAYVDEQVRAFQGVEVVYDERGYRRADDKEVFGFKDGIAQPKVEGIHIYGPRGPIKNPVRTGEFILGYKTQYDLFPTTPVVPRQEDPSSILPPMNNPKALYPLYKSTDLKDLGINGTYVVYRKLEQDVQAFWAWVLGEAERIDGTATLARAVWLAAKMTGRHPNGDPLVKQNDPVDQDDFLYLGNDDGEGLQCPFGSHLRRANPRDQLHPTEKELALFTVNKHRIIRRGRIYGDALFDLSILDHVDESNLATLQQLQDDGQSRGLQFFCVNANIQRQFEFIQDSWGNNESFNALHQNKDPLIGDHGGNQRPSRMSIPHDPVRIRTSPMPRFVKMIGGSYLFMPGITALRYLAS